MSDAGVVSLAALSTGEAGVIQYLDGGRGLINRLATLGFTPGTEVTMVQNYGRGPVIVEVRHARIALGRGETQKVIVKRK